MKLFLRRAVRYLQLTVLFTAISSVGILTGEKSLAWKFELEEKRVLLQKENEQLGMDIKSLERDLTLLRSDPKTIEKVAKRRLGVARPDETVYIFQRSESSSPGASDPESGLDNSHNMP